MPLSLALAVASPGVLAQAAGSWSAAPGWEACAAIKDDGAARLACFDRWAQQQNAAAGVAPSPVVPVPAPAVVAVTEPHGPDSGCHNPRYSVFSHLWELETATDCGTFGIRGYRPISLSWIGSNTVNQQPTSDNPLNNAAAVTPYSRAETRIQLSVRTKIAQGLLGSPEPGLRDSLWFGYSQQSYWQLFNGALSRPFRNTDHEPEVIYLYPLQSARPEGWRWRYGGLGLVHQSNGQSLPLSRSWNRVYLMAGADLGQKLNFSGRIWQRLPEKSIDDDNPHIANYVGRGEFSASWQVGHDDTLMATLRHSLRQVPYGSVRLEWLRRLGNADNSGLRFHTQLFSGYGDSLLDFNRRRTVLGIGLSLVDF